VRWIWAGSLAAGSLGLLLVAPAITQTANGSRASRVTATERPKAPSRVEWSESARADALRRAALWGDMPDGAASPAGPGTGLSLSCRYKADALGGTTPKFECVTDEGDTVKVKYAGAEPHGEVAATSLLRAVGLPADDVRFVERVRCYGCPPFPFLTTKVLGFVNALDLYSRRVDYTDYSDIEWPAVERKYPGTAIETLDRRGWAWYELKGSGAPEAHVDGLRLMAVFLAHWDNKSENQRLVCADRNPAALEREQCSTPLALMQDLGGTFGPRKVSLQQWRGTPIWADRATCLVSMEKLPHGGGTFEPVRISDAGRRFLAERLGRLTPAQIRATFERARFAEHDGEDTREWVRAFEEKVQAITAGPPCPAR
jgi:hypothetical protein